jgi:hypothetical protein
LINLLLIILGASKWYRPSSIVVSSPSEIPAGYAMTPESAAAWSTYETEHASWEALVKSSAEERARELAEQDLVNAQLAAEKESAIRETAESKYQAARAAVASQVDNNVQAAMLATGGDPEVSKALKGITDPATRSAVASSIASGDPASVIAAALQYGGVAAQYAASFSSLVGASVHG